MPDTNPRVTLALLAYNESESIEATVREAANELQNAYRHGEWELLIINDGSRDETGGICDRLTTEFSSVRIYHHNPNRGYIEATLSALREALGNYVCVFDGDGQHTAADVPRFVQKLESGCDVVFGWKKQRSDPPLRLLLTRGLRLAAGFFLHTRLHDINAGCRGYRKEHVHKLGPIKHRINFLGPELYTRARLNELRICEIVVQHKPREAGESSHAWGKIPKEIWEVLVYLRALRQELREAGKHRRFI